MPTPMLIAKQTDTKAELVLLSELFERMPEVGDPEKPKLVFFFERRTCSSTTCPPPSARASSRSSA